jgi:hypothetical protein
MAIRELRKVLFLKIQNCQMEFVTANAIDHSLIQRPSCAAAVGGNPV